MTVKGAHDDQGNILSDEVTFGLLLGDINGDGVVDSTDSHQVKLDRGEATDSTNFREDVKANGQIDAVDFSTVKGQLGTILPP